MNNPYLNKKEFSLPYLTLAAGIIVVHFFSLIYAVDIEIFPAAADSLVYNFLLLIFGTSLWFAVKYSISTSEKLSNILFNNLAAAITISAIWTFSGYLILKYLFIDDKAYLEFLRNSIIWRLLIGILFFSTISLFNFFLIYYNNYKDKLVEEAELNRLVKDSELRTLKYQINPHFIFNSLNSISSLTMFDAAKAQEMTIKLSDYLRGTLSQNEKQIVKLSDELKNVKLYMDIEKVRFPDQFEYIENISENCGKVEVPNMLLQPVIENAIKHGVYESLDKVTITLNCKFENNYLIISIKNNFDPGSRNKKGKGIGLQNIKNRLSLTYGQNNLLTTKSEGNIFTAVIYIPINGG